MKKHAFKSIDNTNFEVTYYIKILESITVLQILESINNYRHYYFVNVSSPVLRDTQRMNWQRNSHLSGLRIYNLSAKIKTALTGRGSSYLVSHSFSSKLEKKNSKQHNMHKF